MSRKLPKSRREKCKLEREAFVNSGKQDVFPCRSTWQGRTTTCHLQSNSGSDNSLCMWRCYQRSSNLNYELCKLSICFSFVTFLLLCFLASNPVDFVHLDIFDGKIMCSSTDCQGYFSITKQQKQKTKTKDMCPYSCPSLCAVFFLCTFHQKSFRLPPPASNKFLSTGSLPLEWKTSLIVPVHKKQCKENVGNYCPISLLCITSKVLERCIFHHVIKHCSKFLHDSQRGFLKGRSTVTQLLEWLSLQNRTSTR